MLSSEARAALRRQHLGRAAGLFAMRQQARRFRGHQGAARTPHLNHCRHESHGAPFCATLGWGHPIGLAAAFGRTRQTGRPRTAAIAERNRLEALTGTTFATTAPAARRPSFVPSARCRPDG